MRRIQTLHKLFTFGAALLAAFPAAAVTLYKLTDRDGSVTYANSVPRGFDGQVRRLEIDVRAQAVSGGSPREAGNGSDDGTRLRSAPSSAEPDLLTQRRATRAALETNLARARERLAQAKATLDEVVDPQASELQGIQRAEEVDEPAPAPPAEPVPPRPAVGGMHGMAPMANCRIVARGGKMVRICGGAVPSAAYRERVAALEHEIRLAEEAVAVAEVAYRRGVD